MKYHKSRKNFFREIYDISWKDGKEFFIYFINEQYQKREGLHLCIVILVCGNNTRHDYIKKNKETSGTTFLF